MVIDEIDKEEIPELICEKVGEIVFKKKCTVKGNLIVGQLPVADITKMPEIKLRAPEGLVVEGNVIVDGSVEVKNLNCQNLIVNLGSENLRYNLDQGVDVDTFVLVREDLVIEESVIVGGDLDIHGNLIAGWDICVCGTLWANEIKAGRAILARQGIFAGRIECDEIKTWILGYHEIKVNNISLGHRIEFARGDNPISNFETLLVVDPQKILKHLKDRMFSLSRPLVRNIRKVIENYFYHHPYELKRSWVKTVERLLGARLPPLH